MAQTNVQAFTGDVEIAGSLTIVGGVDKVTLASDSTNTNRPVIFTTGTANAQPLKTDGGLVYNPSTNKLTVSGGLSQSLSAGSYLLGDAYNGATARTFNVDATITATASKVVARDTAADIFARLFRSNYANQTTISGGMAFRINNSTDSYIRFCSDIPAIRTFLNVPTRTGGDASGTWAISISGNAASSTNVRVDRYDTGDTTMYLTMASDDTASTSKRLYMDTNLVYDNTNNKLTATTFSGALAGTATNADNVQVDRYDSGDTACYLTFTADATAGKKKLYMDSGLVYDNTNNKLTATTFAGTHIGTHFGVISGSNTIAASTVTATSFIGSGSELTGVYIPFVDIIKIGNGAGTTSQGLNAIAVGHDAGQSQGINALAVGYLAGQSNQGDGSIAIGSQAARYNQGDGCIAMGYGAGQTNQHKRTMALNCSDNFLNTNGERRFFVKSIRSNSGSLSWDGFSGEIYANTSDDRIKHNETYIRNALRTIMKLKPQTYDKAPDLESNTYIEMRESGLMVQDIWYDVPEMRHIVRLSQTANPTPEKPPAPSDDPADDPDYSAWGIAPSSLEYDQVVPFLAKAVQEVAVEVPRAKTTVSNTWGQNVTGLVVSANTNKHKTNVTPLVSLSNVFMDKSWYGVVSGEKTDSTDYDTLVDIKGDTRIWVTDLGGSLESGDFITTSNIAPGYTQKQSDDIVHNYTIGKITQDCDFTEPSTITIKVPRQELSNVTYYIYQQKLEINKTEYDFIGMERNKMSEVVTAYRRNEGDEGITQEDYDTLEPSIQEGYIAYQKTKYSRLDRYETKFQNQVTNKMHTIEEIRQELVDVLDENEQTVWEETNETRPVYTLVDHGTYKAALVSCKLI